ncbi:MAG: hypothetical protein ACKVQC_06375 [Elusimicrobiota bacterium]
MKSTAEFKFIKLMAFGVFLIKGVFASFDPLPVGGRAAGMGEAYSAIADDIYALYYNPAGILQINRPEFGTYYSQLYPGLTDSSKISRMYIGYGQPFGKNGKHGGIGVSYLSLGLPSLYKEEAFGLTYGYEYRHLWNFGTTVKLLRKQIGSDNYTSNAIDPITGNSTGSPDPLLAKSKSASGIGLDLGFQYRLTSAYALGLVARNINNPSLSIADGGDKASSVYSAALARKLRKGSLNLEITQWKTIDSNLKLSLGGEHWFKNGFGLRAGGSFGNRNLSNISFGSSYKMESFQLDYAAILPLQGIEGTLGIQQVSLTVRLGKPPVDALEVQLLKEKEDRIRAESEARYAKAESDRLKAQLYALTEAKSQAQKEIEKQAAQKTLDEARQAEKARTLKNQNIESDKVIFNSYTNALAEYNSKVSDGISLSDKRKILEKIQNDFAGKGVDTSTIIRELRNLKIEESKSKKDFDLSLSFYQRLAQQGASIEERKGMLDRIIQKYKGSGVDVSEAEKEMKTLSEGKSN